MDVLDIPPDILNARQSRALSVWEEHLERKLRNEGLKPRSKLQRFRKRGEQFLHSKPVLLAAVVLNCLDCLLVLTELILDVYFIKEMIVTAENTMETFNQLLKDKFPEHFSAFHVHDTHKFYNKILRSQFRCDTNSTIVGMNETSFQTLKSLLDSDDPHFLEEKVHSLEELVAHAFHKTSITILGILVMFTLLKMFCHGLSFVKHKLEVFDSFIVIASFTLDLCYINGLTNYPVESFVVILVVMIPWRIIRVLNSLIIAVKDNLHFLLKLMYKKNKYQREKIEKLETLKTQQQKIIDDLTELCGKYGISTKLALDFSANSNKRKIKKTLSPFGACLSRQVSFELDKPRELHWESLPCLPKTTEELDTDRDCDSQT